MSIEIRKGTKADLKGVLALIKELAEFEKASHEVTNTLDDMEKDGFGEHPAFKVLIAEESTTLEIVGIALYYIGYSTWKGKLLYLDDIVITKSFRRKGIGRMLIDGLMEAAKEEHVKLVKWQVLDWNSPAIEFYKKIHVHFDSEWVNCSLNELQIMNYPITQLT